MVIDKIPGGSGGDHILRNTQTFFIPSHFKPLTTYFTGTFSSISHFHAFMHFYI